MAKLPVLKPQAVLRVLCAPATISITRPAATPGFFHETRGDFKITVPIHPGDLPIPVLKSILRQAGLSNDEFLKLLEQ
jgi:hypothetical protein